MHALGLMAGVLLALWVPAAWQAALGWIALAGGAALFFTRWWRIALLALLGFFSAQHAARQVLYAAFHCGERRLMIAQIQTIPAATAAGWQFDALLAAARPPQLPPLRVRLTSRAALPPHVGERWQYLVQFATPAEGLRGADQARNLLRDHISTLATIRDSPLNQRVEPAPASIDRLREQVARRIVERVADPSAAALLAALAVGASGDVSTGQWRIFNATGITHLVAISGMHVTFFAMLCMTAARWSWRRWSWLAARCRRESFAAAIGVLLAFAYALLSGFSVPAQRTAVMLAAFLLARSCGRVTRPMWSVAVSLVAVLLYDPLAALSAGFWLSFSAVASIVLIAGARLQPAGSLHGAVHVQWVVTAALLPVTVILFGTFSAIGPLVNAAAIPLFTFALVPPVLVATVFYLLPGDVTHFLADHLVDLAAWAASAAWPMLTACANLAGALWAAQPNAMWLCLAVPAALLLLLPVPPVMRAVASLLLLAGFFAPAARPRPGELWLDLFDVGASRAVLLRTARHQLLAGAGEGFGSAGRRFETRILPTLLRAGGAGLDMWILQKPDRDTLQAVTMGHARLVVGETLLGERQRAPPELLPCDTRDWEWDGVRFSMSRGAEGCWVRAQAGSRSLLLTPERVAGTELAAAADVWVLPRRAADAQRLLTAAAIPPALLLAGVAASEWRAGAWSDLRQEQLQRGAGILSTVQGPIRVRMGSAAPVVKQGSDWQAGIWATSRTCAAVP